MLLLIAIIWENIDFKGFLLGGGAVSIILWFLNAIKDRRKDRVVNDKTEADIKKTEAEAAKLKAETEETTASIALQIASRLNTDYSTLKADFEKVCRELEEAHKSIKDLTEKLATAINKLNGELQSALLRDKEMKDLKEEIKNLKIDD